MKLFLQNLILFLFFLALYFGAIYFINYKKYSNQKTSFDTNVLVIGDSHLQFALNPNLFYSCSNVCQPAEPYVLTYWKLKKLLKDNIPDTLIIGFGVHNFSAFNDYKYISKEFAQTMFQRSYTIEEFHTLKKIKINWIEYYKFLFMRMCISPKENHIYYIGKYENTKKSNLKIQGADGTIKRHYYLNNKRIGISSIALDYLDSILNLCAKKGVKPILVSSPVYKSYFNKIPINHQKKFDEIKRKLTAMGIFVIDKTNVYFPDYSFFQCDHLNEIGAERFTREIIQEISQKPKRAS